MIELVVTGGQTGADQAGWRAARTVGIRTGGWLPRDFLTESGPRPEFADLYGAQEHASRDYPPRTRANLVPADAAIVFDGGNRMSPGTRLVSNIVAERGRPPLMVVRCERCDSGVETAWRIMSLAYREPDYVADWLRSKDARTLFVGGNRESKSQGLGEMVEAFLVEVFRLMREDRP